MSNHPHLSEMTGRIDFVSCSWMGVYQKSAADLICAVAKITPSPPHTPHPRRKRRDSVQTILEDTLQKSSSHVRLSKTFCQCILETVVSYIFLCSSSAKCMVFEINQKGISSHQLSVLFSSYVTFKFRPFRWSWWKGRRGGEGEGGGGGGRGRGERKQKSNC